MSAHDLAGGRGHAILPHTADAGMGAHGPTFAAALEEAAEALSELTADVPARHGSPVVEVVDLATTDAAGLLVAWLNELIGLADVHHAALLDTTGRAGPRQEAWAWQRTRHLNTAGSR